MKTSAKRVPFLTALVLLSSLLLTTVFAVFFGKSRISYAEETETNIGLTYYYSELKNSELAQRFYGVMTEMSENGDFIEGNKDYDLKSILTQSDISNYILNGATKIPVALGAARDAFYFDHPDLFYADVYKLTLTVGMQGDSYVAYLGTGRADNYYNDNTVSNADEARAAIEKYNTAINNIVSAARAQSADIVDQIKYVNKVLCDTIEYSYGAYEDKHNGLTYNGYVGTAYSLIEGEALCGGYSTAFKAVMDRLNIPCVLIGGSAFAGKTVTDADTGEELQPGYEAHMWNAVNVDNLWYGVDVTWNDTTNNLAKYMLVGSDFLSKTHIEDPVISSSGFEIKYPAIRPLNYGVDTDQSGFTFKDSGEIGTQQFGYIDIGDDEYTLYLGISYEGKNMKALRDDGKYFATRSCTANGWSVWTCLPAYLDVYLEMSGYNEAEAEEFWNSMIVEDYTVQWTSYNTSQLQFAIVDRLPSDGYVYTDIEIDENAIAVSVPYSNEAYMKFIPAPYVKTMTPNEKGIIRSFDPVEITLEYSERLVKAEGKEDEPVGVTVTSERSDINNYIKVEDVVWNEETNTLSFTFTPSQQYSHDSATYYFTPSNLVGTNSGKVPNPESLSFARKYVVCPKVFNDGRLYMLVYGEPQFVSASDESLSSFKDGNGQPIVGDQRSQLMLVVNEPTKADSEDMEKAAMDEFDLDETDIYASSTYQIDLHICGMVQKVPAGSYMQVGFGFPEGYGPEDEGVTFTVYHYTRDANGEIDTVEAVPCIVTPYGIIATVKSFSPFMICAVNSDKVSSTAKNILATVDGAGGTVDDLDIITLNGGSVTYTLTPDSGYTLYSVTVNGVERKTDVTADGKLTLDFDELNSSNIVKVSFIADSVVAADLEKGITRIQQPDLVVDKSDLIVAYTSENAADTSVGAPPKKTNTALIVGIVIAVVVVVAACGVAVFFILRNKSKTQAKATASKSSSTNAAQKTKTSSSSAVKTNSAARTKTGAASTKSNKSAKTTASRSKTNNTTTRKK